MIYSETEILPLNH